MAKETVTVACKLPAGLNLGFVTLNGSNHRSAIGGFGLTPNVDAQAFDKWATDHARLPAVSKGLVFAQSRRSDAQAAARELSELTHGAEAIDPEKPDPKGGDDKITPTDEQVKETKKQKADREAREAEQREIEDGEAGKD